MGGWQKGDEGRIKATFTDTETKALIKWAGTSAEITVKPPGGVEAPIASSTPADGRVEALYTFALAGTYTGHITLTGGYKRKVPWKLIVGDD